MSEDTAPVAAAPVASTEESKFIKFFKDDDEGRNAPRQRWAGSTTFILAAIGSAIGLGNFWRFPYLTFKWGGGIWFIPYLIALMLLGLPMMLLELSLGQLFQRGDIGVFRGIHPRLYGVGLASVFSAFAINIFYTYLIAIAGCYLFVGITHPTLPWSIQRTKDYQDTMCVDHIVTEGECIETVNEDGLTVVTGCT
jgi:SNF family Na+-dependent transporter